VLGGETGERLRGEQRRVAGQHENVVFGVEVFERAGGERDAHRITGAALHALLDELDRHFGRELFLERLRDALGAVPDDHDDALERQRRERVDHVQHHRAAAQRVQHLRGAGAHARALTSGEYHCGERSILAHGRLLNRLRSGARVRTSTRDSKGPGAACYTTPDRHLTILRSSGHSTHGCEAPRASLSFVPVLVWSLHSRLRSSACEPPFRSCARLVTPVLCPSGRLIPSNAAMGSLIKKRRKRMRKKKHKKLLKKTRWQRRQQGK
jgi:hypothetical protein